jgi:hypothetical protein
MWSPSYYYYYFYYYFYFIFWVGYRSLCTYKCSKGSLYLSLFLYIIHATIGFSVFKQTNKTSKQTCLSPIICGIFLGIYLSIRSSNQLHIVKDVVIVFREAFFRVTCSRINIQHKLLNKVVCHLDYQEISLLLRLNTSYIML